MNKKRLTLILTGWMLFIGASRGICLELLKGPYLQNVSQTAITIMWETDKEATSQVRYGLADQGELDQVVQSDESVRIHEVRLESLQPQTRYRYQIISERSGEDPVESAIATFQTAPYPGTPFRFVVWGDNRTDVRTCERVAQLIADQEPDLVINVGDVVTNGLVYAQWGHEYFEPISRFASQVPTYIAIGNHERDAHWFDDFVSQPGNEHWFAFSYGNARFIILDTNRPHHPRNEQHQWLVEELNSEAFQNATFRFAFFHHPPYSEQWDSPGYTGELSTRAFLVPVLESYGVDIVFSGHTHDYERGTRTLETGGEITYVITGGGGSALDRVETKDWDVIQLHRSRYHCVVVDVAGPTLTYQAVALNGEVLDSFTKQKGAPEPTGVNASGKLSTLWGQIKRAR